MPKLAGFLSTLFAVVSDRQTDAERYHNLWVKECAENDRLRCALVQMRREIELIETADEHGAVGVILLPEEAAAISCGEFGSLAACSGITRIEQSLKLARGVGA